MAKLTTATARKDQGACRSCGAPIVAGDKYVWFKLYATRGVRYCHHDRPGCLPRPSQMTSSDHKSSLLAAQEALHDAAESIRALLPEDVGDGTDVVSLAVDAANAAAEEARTAESAYEEAAEHFGGQGPNAEAAEYAGAWADSLDSFDTPDRDDYTDDTDGAADWIEAVGDALDEVANELETT